MTPNTKHLEILSEVTGLYEVECTSEFQRINVLAALQAMQILQLRIDELEKENENLFSTVANLQDTITDLHNELRDEQDRDSTF